MYQRTLRRLFLLGIPLFFVVAGASMAYGEKPPWAGGPGGPKDYPRDPPPVSAPEPITLSLIGMGLAGAAGYYLANKKRRK